MSEISKLKRPLTKRAPELSKKSYDYGESYWDGKDHGGNTVTLAFMPEQKPPLSSCPAHWCVLYGDLAWGFDTFAKAHTFASMLCCDEPAYDLVEKTANV